MRGLVLEQKNIFLHEIDFVVQRLEPMKAPFPPVGRISINNYLTQLKKLFPQKFTFNFLVEAYQDKEFPLQLAKKYEDLATPTAISFYGDLEMPKKVQEMGKKYSEIFKTSTQKIVLKPDDSAQALGVFAVEISATGLNLEQIKNKTIAQLSEVQLYEINAQELPSDIIEIINILCFVQFCKTKFTADQRLIADIAPQEIAQAINSLYGKKILMQPFLEGVRLGDIRINLAKMSDGNFKVVGAVFRHSIAHDEKNFTTCLTIGASRAQAIELDASVAEQKNLAQKINYILQQLNGDEALKTKYRDVLEIGCDFLLVGNQRDVFFGEANHHCPALMPLSESLEAAKKAPSFYEEINGLKVPYDGGLAVAKAIISQQIKLQN